MLRCVHYTCLFIWRPLERPRWRGKQIPTLVQKGVGIVSFVNVSLTLKIFSMSPGEARRQVLTFLGNRKGIAGPESRIHFGEDPVGSWQNQVLSQVFGMRMHPRLSGALDPQKGTLVMWGNGDGCPCPNISVFSWPLHPEYVVPLSLSELSPSYSWFPRPLC